MEGILPAQPARRPRPLRGQAGSHGQALERQAGPPGLPGLPNSGLSGPQTVSVRLDAHGRLLADPLRGHPAQRGTQLPHLPLVPKLPLD